MHRASPRRCGQFIAINCAAVPEQALESELLSYQRGVVTGAQRSKVG
jgi:two-component system NtrC family response regulator